MTVEIIAKCDGRGCHNFAEIESDTDKSIERVGWGIDQEEGFCYCKACWPTVKKEIEERD